MAVAIAEAQFHVLAVDDSLPDRKLIERLLKTSSFQGINHIKLLLVLFPASVIFLLWHLMQNFVANCFLQLPLLILGPRLWSSWGSMVKTPQFLSMQTTW
jgi:hypothetical protein